MDKKPPRGAVSWAVDRNDTGLLPCETGGWCHPFSRVDIDVDHKKRVDLGVLRGADHDGLVLVSPFSTVDGVCFDGASSSR